MKYQECYLKGRDALADAGVEEAVLDARLLLEFICGTNRNYLLVHGDKDVTEEQEQAYFEVIKKRASRIPLQHITGVQNFMGLDFKVSKHVLIPRQDTEILVEEVLRQMSDGSRILDMCTGSGCILTSLLHYNNWCEGVGVDVSADALEVAKYNASNLLKDKEQTSFRFIESNLFENVEGMFDVIVSNPPYIATDVIETLMPEVKEHEPRLALDGTEDGLFFYRKIVDDGRSYLKNGGMLYFEIGHDQGAEVKALMEQAGFIEVVVVKDYAGLDRVVYGTKKEVDHV